MTTWALDNIVKRFGGSSFLRRGATHVAVDGVSLSVEEGERIGVIGESGSGKTTLARTGLGLLRPDGGTVKLFGEDTAGWNEQRWRQARHKAQLLFQDPKAMLNPAMRIGDLLRESAALHDPGRDPRVAAGEILEAVGLGGREHALPHQLSGGERRRAGVARLLLARPRLVVADEPTAGLDAALKADLLEMLLDRIGEQTSLVLISHDVPLVLWCCSRVVVMKDGRIVDRFASDEVGQVPHHPHTQALLEAAGILVAEAARGTA